MPQTTYMPLYTASYPILAKAQKPGGVTVLSAVGAGDVPNKGTWAAGTIQMALGVGPESVEETEVETEESRERVESPAEEPPAEER
jgi:hypothetical protein